MDFRKILKRRLYINIIYSVIGLSLIICSLILKPSEIEILTAFGIAFFAAGAVRIIQYFRITKNEDRVRQIEIKEKDERNVLIWTKAKSMAFSIYISLSGIAVVVFYLINMEFIAQIVAYNICIFVIIYYICCLILSRKY